MGHCILTVFIKSITLQYLLLGFENAALVVLKHLEASFETVVKTLALPTVVATDPAGLYNRDIICPVSKINTTVFAYLYNLCI